MCGLPSEHSSDSDTSTPITTDSEDRDDTDEGPDQSMPVNPQLQDFEKFRQMLRKRALDRDRVHRGTDTDPEEEAPGPTAPHSPMRALPGPSHQPLPPQ